MAKGVRGAREAARSGGVERAQARAATRLGLADLGQLRSQLKAEQARREAEAAHLREAARLQALAEADRQREALLFRAAVADVKPLVSTPRVARPRPILEPIARQFQQDEQQALAQTLSDEIDLERLLEHDDRLSFRRPGIGLETLNKLRRGQWVAQAALDLHGLRSDEAREAVTQFLPLSVRDGLRCVRIIHGKGLGSIQRQPVLKDKVLRWLVQRDEVIAFCEAPPHTGGSGALMVLLQAPTASRRQ